MSALNDSVTWPGSKNTGRRVAGPLPEGFIMDIMRNNMVILVYNGWIIGVQSITFQLGVL